MNQNELAVRIAMQEGLKVTLKIGQIKEVLRITLDELCQMPEQELIEFFRQRREKKFPPKPPVGGDHT